MNSFRHTNRTPLGEKLSLLVVRLLALEGHLSSAGDALATPEGHTSARWRILAACELEPRTAAWIAGQLQQARQSVQRIVDDLKRDGALIAQDNPDDKRAPLLSLTPKGRQALVAIQKRQIAWANTVGAALGAKALDHLSESLTSFTAVLAQHHPEKNDE